MAEEYRPLVDENFSYDAQTQKRTKLEIDSEGILHFTTTQPDDNLRKYAHESRMSYADNERLGDVVKVGSIPSTVILDLMIRGIWDDEDAMTRWWRSLEAAPYKTRDFKV